MSQVKSVRLHFSNILLNVYKSEFISRFPVSQYVTEFLHIFGRHLLSLAVVHIHHLAQLLIELYFRQKAVIPVFSGTIYIEQCKDVVSLKLWNFFEVFHYRLILFDT